MKRCARERREGCLLVGGQHGEGLLHASLADRSEALLPGIGPKPESPRFFKGLKGSAVDLPQRCLLGVGKL